MISDYSVLHSGDVPKCKLCYCTTDVIVVRHSEMSDDTTLYTLSVGNCQPKFLIFEIIFFAILPALCKTGTIAGILKKLCQKF